MRAKSSEDPKHIERSKKKSAHVPQTQVHATTTVPSSNESDISRDDSEMQAQVRNLAYKFYEERGCVDGQDLQDWLKAESIIRKRGNFAA